VFAFPRKSVDFLTLFSVRQKHGAEVSLSADSDQGFSPWTLAAFFSKNSCTKKIFFESSIPLFIIRKGAHP